MATTSSSSAECTDQSCISSLDTATFTCGECSVAYYTICKLHKHLKGHGAHGSYFYDSYSQIAFPTFGSSCKATQTLDEVEKEMLEVTRNYNMDSGTDHQLILDKLRHGDELNNSINQKNIINDELENSSQEAELVGIDLTTTGKHFEIELCNSKTMDSVISPMVLSEDEKDILSNYNKDNYSYLFESDSATKKGFGIMQTKQKNLEIRSCAENEIAKRKTTKQKKKLKQKGKKGVKKKGKEVVSIKCRLCTLEFTSKESLREHKKEAHARRHKCEICGKILSCHSGLQRHILVHSGLSPYMCGVCNKTYRSVGELNVHRKRHSDVKNYICQHCGSAFSASNLLRLHIIQCRDIRPYKCERDECGKKFRCRASLILHERSHSGEKPFICDQCGSAFSRADKLTIHRYTHLGIYPFKCEQCPKSFRSKDHMQRHARIHCQDSSYKCDQCNKTFTQNWNLKAHMRQHSGEKPYKCDKCGLGFAHNVSRKAHMANCSS